VWRRCASRRCAGPRCSRGAAPSPRARGWAPTAAGIQQRGPAAWPTPAPLPLAAGHCPAPARRPVAAARPAAARTLSRRSCQAPPNVRPSPRARAAALCALALCAVARPSIPSTCLASVLQGLPLVAGLALAPGPRAAWCVMRAGRRRPATRWRRRREAGGGVRGAGPLRRGGGGAAAAQRRAGRRPVQVRAFGGGVGGGAGDSRQQCRLLAVWLPGGREGGRRGAAGAVWPWPSLCCCCCCCCRGSCYRRRAARLPARLAHRVLETESWAWAWAAGSPGTPGRLRARRLRRPLQQRRRAAAAGAALQQRPRRGRLPRRAPGAPRPRWLPSGSSCSSCRPGAARGPPLLAAHPPGTRRLTESRRRARIRLSSPKAPAQALYHTAPPASAASGRPPPLLPPLLPLLLATRRVPPLVRYGYRSRR
jgi:hypothetical protein